MEEHTDGGSGVSESIAEQLHEAAVESSVESAQEAADKVADEKEHGSLAYPFGTPTFSLPAREYEADWNADGSNSRQVTLFKVPMLGGFTLSGSIYHNQRIIGGQLKDEFNVYIPMKAGSLLQCETPEGARNVTMLRADVVRYWTPWYEKASAIPREKVTAGSLVKSRQATPEEIAAFARAKAEAPAAPTRGRRR